VVEQDTLIEESGGLGEAGCPGEEGLELNFGWAEAGAEVENLSMSRADGMSWSSLFVTNLSRWSTVM
jgi:hypothetical protein